MDIIPNEILLPILDYVIYVKSLNYHMERHAYTKRTYFAKKLDAFMNISGVCLRWQDIVDYKKAPFARACIGDVFLRAPFALSVEYSPFIFVRRYAATTINPNWCERNHRKYKKRGNKRRDCITMCWDEQKTCYCTNRLPDSAGLYKSRRKKRKTDR